MGGCLLIQITPQMRILVAIEAIDGRKGIDSLAQLCREKLRSGPFSGCLFIFRNRSAKAIRIFAESVPAVVEKLNGGSARFCENRVDDACGERLRCFHAGADRGAQFHHNHSTVLPPASRRHRESIRKPLKWAQNWAHSRVARKNHKRLRDRK